MRRYQSLGKLRIAVYAAVDFFLLVDQFEFVRNFLFNGSYATRILAFDHACEHFREIQVNFFFQVT